MITSCWVVSQQPDEYNPIHYHHNDISAVMYLKIPKIKTDRKASDAKDGHIEFLGVGSQNHQLSSPQLSMYPDVGDLLIFGSRQFHTVYPFRCEEGEKETERRSVSFNARFKLET